MKNKANLPRPYIIVKPDGARYLAEIERVLQDYNIKISQIFCIRDWGKTAREIYQHQLQLSNKEFCVGFDTHIWLNQYLFGNQALLLVLKIRSIKRDFSAQIRHVYRVRNIFRKKFNASLSARFTVIVNMERLKTNNSARVGRRGQLGVRGASNLFKPLFDRNFEGRWDHHYFKYIHSPGNIEELKYEWEKLTNNGIMVKSNVIGIREWKLLKRMRSLVHPKK